MSEATQGWFFTDEVWAVSALWIEIVRPEGKTPPQDLQRTLSAVVWRHENGARWRSVPAEYGPWSRAAQLSIRWSKMGVFERLMGLAQERGLSLGLVFLDGTVIRAHHKAAGAKKGGCAARSATAEKRWAALAAALARRPA